MGNFSCQIPANFALQQSFIFGIHPQMVGFGFQNLNGTNFIKNRMHNNNFYRSRGHFMPSVRLLPAYRLKRNLYIRAYTSQWSTGYRQKWNICQRWKLDRRVNALHTN